MRRNFCFLYPLHAKRAFLHHAAHTYGDVRIFLHLDNVRRAFGGERREIFFIDAQCTCDLLFADWSLIVIEVIESAYLEWAVIRAISRADAAVVRHDVKAILAMDGCVHRTNRFARCVLAVLAHHRFVHDLRVFRPVATVLVEWFSARIIAVDANPVHRAAMSHLQLADYRDVVLGLAGNHTGAAPGADIQIDTHPPLLGGVEWRMNVDARQPMRQVFLAGHFFCEIIVSSVTFKCRFPHKTAAFNAEMFLSDRERISAAELPYADALDPLPSRDNKVWIRCRAQEVAVETTLFCDLRLFFKCSARVRQCTELWHFPRVTQWDGD